MRCGPQTNAIRARSLHRHTDSTRNENTVHSDGRHASLAGGRPEEDSRRNTENGRRTRLQNSSPSRNTPTRTRDSESIQVSGNPSFGLILTLAALISFPKLESLEPFLCSQPHAFSTPPVALLSAGRCCGCCSRGSRRGRRKWPGAVIGATRDVPTPILNIS